MFEDVFGHEDQKTFFERWFVDPVPYLRARWLFLRLLGFVFLSAFYALYFQIHGLIGPKGILPAASYLPEARAIVGWKAIWYIPSLFWFGARDVAMSIVVWIGIAASVAILFNLWPRLSIFIALICFLSFVSAAQDFSSYQSDGMLLEAAFLSLFFAPRGLRPGLGIKSPPTRATLFLLQWEWFRIYFESGMVKILSGEEQWRNLTAMDKYYENGPLPTWLGWYVQHFPHTFHAFTAAATLVIELLIVWLLFLPRPARIVCFVITTALQIGIILTANYAFLNYLVLFLGVLLLDDRVWSRIAGRRSLDAEVPMQRRDPRAATVPIVLIAITLILFFITSIVVFMMPAMPLLNAPAVLFAPFRIVNTYGLFAVMTRARYEIEFQGTNDFVHWTAYPFRYKAQNVRERPGIYAPYQPRFDWNLWFASLGSIEENRWVMNTEVRLLENSAPVLQLFRGNPFPKPPAAVRVLMWQYWFSTREEKAKLGIWWDRKLIGAYAPTAVRQQDGSVRFE